MRHSLKNLLVPVLLCLCMNSYGSEVLNFNKDWKFSKGNPEKAAEVAFDDAAWTPVRLPHDWAISGPFNPASSGSTGKLPWKGDGWYRKHFVIEESRADQKVFLLFDGAMAFPQVYVNGKLAGSWDYGYNSFFVDVTSFVEAGKDNVVAVYLNTASHNSRWYPGAGLYRKVSLIYTNKTRVDIWGTQVLTPVVSRQQSQVVLRTRILCDEAQDQKIEVTSRILSPDGKEVASVRTPFKIRARNGHVLEQKLSVSDVQLWDLDAPNLYTVQTIISREGKELDVTQTTFGFRTVVFTANDGMLLNGRRVDMKGVCLHHDQGALGAAFLPVAMERQLRIMKEMGVNAIRNSHNVAAPELPELCDRMGLLMINEAFDKWDGFAGITRTMDPMEFLERNFTNFILRDRNHPCVVAWSVNNEDGAIIQNSNNGFKKLELVARTVRSLDPTRPITMACHIAGAEAASLRSFDYLDIHSWNYERRYEHSRALDPTKPVLITESASTVSTRGYYNPVLPAKKTDFDRNNKVSSYDFNTPAWAEIPEQDFVWGQDDRYVCGEFVWTGFDYIGEPTPYNTRSSYFGIVDLAGIPKDRYYLYRSYWAPEKTTIHILPHWNWEGSEHKIIPVFVYTNGDAAELFLNGKSLGMKKKDPRATDITERFRLMWKDVAYAPGELKVVAYKNGQPIGEKVMRTAGKPAVIRLSPETVTLKSNGDDLAYVLVEALDSKGNLCPLADNEIRFTVQGAAMLEATDNGDQESMEPFQSPNRKLFYGKAMLILRSVEGQTGPVTVTAESKGLKKAVAKLTAL